MSINTPEGYGRDVACFDDANGLFTDVTGLAIVRQDAYHRLTNDSVLGSTDGDANPETDNWGYDVQRLAGLDTRALAGIPPILSSVLQRDPRIATADVSLQRVSPPGAPALVILRVTCTTALGPFSLVLSIDDVTVAILGGSSA